MIHSEKHPLAGATVILHPVNPYEDVQESAEYRIEDWWDRVAGKSWMDCEGNPACIQYAVRSSIPNNIPMDDEVVYGKIGYLGYLVHVSELGEVLQ